MSTSSLQVSQRFCASDTDLTVCSSDGVLFKVHLKNLGTHSGVFAGAGDATRPENGDEPVELSETADVLGLLFQFMYPQPQPDLRSLNFTVLAALAEAAEKYMVYPALAPCRLRMNDSVCAHPLEVLVYAVRHDHISLANESAHQSMGCAVAQALDTLPPDTFREWLLFYERWHRETAKSLAYMATFSQHASLVQKCTADPNPACTFRKELDAAGGWSRTIREMKFMTDPKVARIQRSLLRSQCAPIAVQCIPVFSF
ncbi:hypothetical protein DFH08DRAFT_862684 [Mycena albidolilacea]|uniref:BTB domain-containing protein n=1 Tax=Mycena albidolilacea TaxID=1033008 RepID=A0AAD7A7Y5_9AGAR|nr:hypothetical protein DFH08DRAFT_862684 [Mycena albidolilacea]